MNLILCQVVMTKTLTGYDVMVYVNVIFAFKMSLLSEKHLMTVVINGNTLEYGSFVNE